MLDIDGNVTEMTVSVTNRRSSYFVITLNICDIPDSIIGNYMCQIGNVSEEIEVQGEVHFYARHIDTI